jgi:hypothetical protein
MLDKHALEKLLLTPEPPDLGPGPRGGVRPERELNDELDQIFRGADLSEERQQLIRALVLLWHDHLDAAHVIAQSIENPDGALVHGIMHRREPDYGNAAYWFRRVGRHPAFPELARRVRRLLDSNPKVRAGEEFISGGSWDPFGFVAACEHAAALSVPQEARLLLREVQRVETETVLDNLCS